MELWPEKQGEIVARGATTQLVRVYLGRDPRTGPRKYHTRPFDIGRPSPKVLAVVTDSFSMARSLLEAVLRRYPRGKAWRGTPLI
jgi:hypothetical protein